MANRTTHPDAEGKFQATIDNAELDAQAAKYRAMALSYREIAAQMGCTVSTAHQRVKRALAAVPVENVTELRRVELDRMDDLIKRHLVIAGKNHLMVSHGRIIPGVSDLGPNLAAMRELRYLSESRRKLLGLDAPALVRVTVTDEVTAEIERLSMELGVLTDATAPVGPLMEQL